MRKRRSLASVGVMENTQSAQLPDGPPEPNAALKNLDVMVGVWDLAGVEAGTNGEINGRLRFAWMDGGFYLVQHVEVDYAGREVSGVEYIGYDEASGSLRSYFFSNEGPGPFGGVAIEYVWEVGDGTLTIWGGEIGSPANFKGAFSADRNTISGRWEWPGGGYSATLTRAGSR
jgi:hypothetical protein